MGYKYMDIWYHKHSRDMAEYIYDDYLAVVGCGRIAEVTYKSDIHKINRTYERIGGEASQVQLILSNSATTSRAILTYFVKELGFRNKIYIFGISNGREQYWENYIDILKEHRSLNDTLVFPLSPLLNMDIPQVLYPKLWNNTGEYLDDIYRNIQERKCKISNETGQRECAYTSWLPYVSAGTQLIVHGLTKSLRTGYHSKCNTDLRNHIFSSIVGEDNEEWIAIYPEAEKVAFFFKDRALALGFKFAVYRGITDTVIDVGTFYPDWFNLTREDVLSDLPYSRTCSSVCEPGYYRLYDDQVTYLTCCWTCVPCQKNQISVGYNSNLCRQCNTSETAVINRTACVNMVPDFLLPSDSLFITATTVICLGDLGLLVIAGVVFRNRKRPVIKASDPGYLYMVLFSLLLGMNTSFIPLLKPDQLKCSAEYLFFLVSTTLIWTNLLWKCIKIYGIFAAANNFEAPKYSLLLKRAGQTWMNVGSLMIVAGLAAVDLVTGPGWLFVESQVQPHSRPFLLCEGTDPSRMPLMLLPLCIPALYFASTLVLAFKMRHFPHNFRETLNIFAATLMALFCCVIFLSGYTLSNRFLRGFLRTIVMFVFSAVFLLCLFLPKMMLLLRKDVVKEKEDIIKSLSKFSNMK